MFHERVNLIWTNYFWSLFCYPDVTAEEHAHLDSVLAEDHCGEVAQIRKGEKQVTLSQEEMKKQVIKICTLTYLSIIVRPSSSIKRVFLETVKQINDKFCAKVAIHHISRPFFPFLQILIFEFKRFFFRFH